MKKLLAVLLTLAICIPCFSAVGLLSSAAVSEHVYMIVTNPGENMDTQMNIGWHSDFTYTGCYVEFTTADDASFAHALRANGTYDDNDYLWFMDRSTTIAIGPDYFETPFLNYGVTLNGLTPDTDYIYRVCDGEGGYSETYSFKTAGQDEFSIMWLSDMHLSLDSNKNTKYQATIDYVSSLAKYDLGLYFNTGDVVSSGDRYTFWEEYYGYDVMKELPYAATVGNHDVFDSMMDDDPNFTEFWQSSEYFRIVSNYPKNGYTQTDARINNYLSNRGYTSYSSASCSDIFTVEDGLLAGKKITGARENTDGKAYWFIYNRILFIVFDYYAMTYDADITNAFNWAYDVIEANKGKYDYLFASEHLNIFWGDSGTSRYYNRYQAFLDQANVDVFFCGDNHIYFRSNSLVNGAVNTDPEKGTYFLQAPAVTNTSSYSLHEGAVGVGVSRYADTDYLGGVMIDVDESGLHFTVATATGDGSNYAVRETFDLPKKVRYPDAVPGIYELKEDVTIYETTDLTSTVLTTIPQDTLVEVYEGTGIWGKIHYNGMSGWTKLTNAELIYEMDVPSTHASQKLTGGFNAKYSTNGLYAYTPAYGATIANGGWTFANNTVWIATEQDNGTYKITSINAEKGAAKNTTPTSDTTVVIMADAGTAEALAEVLVLDYTFTLDWAQSTLNAVDAEVGTAPEYTFHNVEYYGKDGEYLGTNKVLSGHAVTGFEAPAIYGLTFTGWDKDCSAVTEDIKLTAQYEVSKYTVEFVVDDQVIDTQTVLHGAAATAPTIEDKEGYTFSGWSTSFDSITADTTVSAFWNINSYTVTFVADGETVDTQTVKHGEAATAPAIPEKEGYTAEWDIDFSEITADTTVTAVYTEIPGDVVYGDVNGDGEVNSLDAAQVLKFDAMMIELSENALVAADVTGEGTVDSLDAAQILKFDAMIIDAFPVEAN